MPGLPPREHERILTAVSGPEPAAARALRARLAERHIELTITDAVREHLVRVGYDPAYGARPLKRAIQKEIETPLARKLVTGDIRDGQSVHVSLRNHQLTFDVESAAHANAS